MHQKNIQVLATYLYKFVIGLSSKLVVTCFKLNNIWLCTILETGPLSILGHFPQHYMVQNHSPISHLGPKIWELVPNDMKNLLTLTAFKKTMEATCLFMSAFRVYIYQVGLYIYVCVCVCIYIYNYMWHICVCIYICTYICNFLHLCCKNIIYRNFIHLFILLLIRIVDAD